jgi:hypothetical protein
MASPREPEFGLLLARLARALRSHDVPFMLIGGQAVLLHGEPRLTLDVDVTLGVSPEALGTVLAACEAMGVNPLPRTVEDFVRETFVLPVSDPATNIRIDLIFSTTPFEAAAIGRAIEVEVAGELVPFATAEDLIIHKLFAGRPRDLEDAEGIVRRKGSDLDWDYLDTWAEEFAAIPGREGMPGAIRRLRSS